MKFIVSICNKQRAEQAKLPDIFLFELSTKQLEPKPIALKHPDIPPARGITGLAHYHEGILALLQIKPMKLVYFNRQYKVENVWTLTLAKDGHSITVNRNKVYIASCGTDSVIEFDPDLGEKVFWQDNGQGKDSIHLNSIAWHNGELYVTAFGSKKGELWSSADAGYLMNITSGQIITCPLYHPHSALSTNEGIYLCESSRMAVRRVDGQSLVVGTGYTRGLFITPTHLYVGTSKGRVKSKSTGKVIDNPADPGLMAGECKVLIYGRKKGNLESGKLIGQACLEEYAEEIYDILPL